MKELSIEEKANAYNNVRNKIAARFGNNVAQEIFSEYEESEDEKIRKSIIRCLKGNMPDNDYRKEYIAWLEKQKQGEKTKPIEGFDTEFERQISHLIASIIDKEYEYTEAFVKWTSETFLNYAKHELEKQSQKKCIDDLTQQEAMDIAVAKCFEQGEKEETPCDRCKKKQPSHSCQDITSLGRCYMEGEQKSVDDIQKPTDIKIHEGDKNNPYDMSFEEAQYYISERCFDICCVDYPVFVDDKYILQTIGNILKWADDNPKREFIDIKPKFKVGDWITSDEGYINDDFRPCKIVGVSDGCYTIQTINGNKGYNTFKIWENEYRLWSIADAKPGDVLFQDLMCGKTFIYNGVNPDMAILYSFIINNDGEDVLPYRIGKPNTGIGYIEENKNIIHPATKEQRDMLFQKMHEAGYTFDFEKKELKKIESLTDFEKAFKGMCCDKNKQFAKECCKTLLELAKKQLQSKRNEFELDEISYKVGVKRVLENPESYGLTKNRLKLSTSDIKALEDIMNGNSNPTSYLVLQSIINQLKNT